MYTHNIIILHYTRETDDVTVEVFFLNFLYMYIIHNIVINSSAKWVKNNNILTTTVIRI